MKKTHRWKNISEAELREAYSTSDSVSAMLRMLNFPTIGTSHFATLRKKLAGLGLSYNDKVLQGRITGNRNSGATRRHKLSNKELFKQFSNISRGAVKRRFIQITQAVNCSICNQQPLWNNKPLVMRLDHINGTTDDNRIENLRVICPNCDSQLDTFCSKNMEARTPPKSKLPDKRIGPKFGKRKYNRPTKEKLIDLIKKHPITVIAKQLGVKSDNLIRKWCTSYNINHQSLSPYCQTKARRGTN